MDGGVWPYRTRDLITLSLVVLCTLLELGVHLGMGIAVVYTHFFYPVLVLAAVWYRERAVLLAVYLGILTIAVSAWIGEGLVYGSFIRAAFFILVTLVAIYAVRWVEREGQKETEYRDSRTRRIRGSLTAIARNLHGIRTGLGGTAAIRRMQEARDVAGLVHALSHRDPEIRYAAAEALAAVPSAEAIPGLVRALGDPHQGVRWKAGEALTAAGPGALPALIPALGDPDPDIRWRAAVVLGDIGGPGAVEPLIRALGDPDPYTRSRAEQALGRIGPEAVGPLRSHFMDGEPGERQAAASALGWTRDPAAVGPLISALADGDPGVRDAAFRALEHLGDLAVEPLTGALGHGSAAIRWSAAVILGRLADPRAARALREALGDPDPAVRHAAGEALAGLGGEVLEDLFAAAPPAPDRGEPGL